MFKRKYEQVQVLLPEIRVMAATGKTKPMEKFVQALFDKVKDA